MARRGIGRPAIEALKTIYQTGHRFNNAFEIRGYLLTTLGVKQHEIMMHHAVAWDRQARYELYELNISVTAPVGALAWSRDSRAASAHRELSVGARLRDAETRVRHLRSQARADAAQADATLAELRMADALEMAHFALKQAQMI